MSESWDDYAEEWDKNEDAISYSEKTFETLTNEVRLEGLNVLDFGCGTGLLTEKISKLANQIVALDSSRKMVSILENKNIPNVTTISKPISESLIKENSLLHNKFDLIVASSVFSFLPEFEETLVMLKSLLVPSGLLIQWDWLSSKDDPEFGFSVERVSSAYSKTGFDIKSITNPFSHVSPKGNTPVLMGIAKNA